LFSFKDKTSNPTDKHLDDVKNFKIVMEAFKKIEMPEDEVKEIFDIIASVLHLGNVTFGQDVDSGKSTVYESEFVHAIANVSN
jgi:myosin heavy subunit